MGISCWLAVLGFKTSYLLPAPSTIPLLIRNHTHHPTATYAYAFAFLGVALFAFVLTLLTARVLSTDVPEEQLAALKRSGALPSSSKGADGSRSTRRAAGGRPVR